MTIKPRVALIHATPLAMQPIANAFQAIAPEIETFNLLEDSLSKDQANRSSIEPRMFERFEKLTQYAIFNGAKGILFTCSAFGPAIDACAKNHPLPILKPNEAMFEECLKIQAKNSTLRVALVATFQASLAPMQEEFLAMADQHNMAVDLQCIFVKEAMDDLSKGNPDLHHKKVAHAVGELNHMDAIMLAQFSMAQAQNLAQSMNSAPVLTSPECAAHRIRKQLLS